MTTIKIGGVELPFFKTMRGVVEFERGPYSYDEMSNGKIEAVLYSVYCTVKGACLREAVVFEMDFETFIDNVEPDILAKLPSITSKQETEPSKKKKAFRSEESMEPTTEI